MHSCATSNRKIELPWRSVPPAQSRMLVGTLRTRTSWKLMSCAAGGKDRGEGGKHERRDVRERFNAKLQPTNEPSIASAAGARAGVPIHEAARDLLPPLQGR